MELTINTNNFQFIDYSCIYEKTNKNSDLIMKRLQGKYKNKFFKKWFEREHDYCLPIKNVNKFVTQKKYEKCEDNSKLFDSNLSTSSKSITKFEKTNVINEFSSGSLNDIDVTTELDNEDKPLNVNRKDKLNVFEEFVPTKLFSPMDIDMDNDIVKLFPILDFSIEYNLNENLEETASRELPTKNINLSINTEESDNDKILSSSESFTLTESHHKSSQPISKCKNDTAQPKLSNNLCTLSAVDSKNVQCHQLASEQYINIFNRYQCKSKVKFIEQLEVPGPILLKDLLCGSKPKTIISPYTHRHLKPYIFRDPVTKPLWLQMLNELKEYFRKKKGLPECSVVIETIDYSYIRAKYIKSVNLLARQFFWDGIDLSESLLYPDFSVIALYKNLIIGFGFMVPDISTNENYITFLFTRPYWTGSGIGKFMLYHLIQTCMTRDITLHVSPNNPAMILYQKFGFKIEEFVQNFYENYVPIESEMSKHALFLRLRSTFQNK